QQRRRPQFHQRRTAEPAQLEVTVMSIPASPALPRRTLSMMKAACVLTSVFALCLAAAPAEAQLARSFVSAAIGNDANAPNCNRPTPCRSFQIAHDNTLDKGEITVLDPGSYGAVLIVKNISIINDGIGEAGILVSGGNTGISVNAAGASVSLRGLTI